MHMALPKNVPTLKARATGNYTCPDNMCITTSLLEQLISCSTVPEARPAKSDHFPIDTVLELRVDNGTQTPPKFKYQEVEWKAFNNYLTTKLQDTIGEPEPTSETMFYHNLRALNTAIIDTVELLVPKTIPSLYMKRWWTQDLMQLRKTTLQLGRKAYKKGGDCMHEAHKKY